MRLCLAGFLILLLLSAAVDNTWIADFVSPISVPDDDDDYLPAEQQQSREQLLAPQILATDGQKPRAADTTLIEGEAGYESKVRNDDNSNPLYVLMSLQR